MFWKDTFQTDRRGYLWGTGTIMVVEMNGKGSVAVKLKPFSDLFPFSIWSLAFLEVIKQVYLKLGFSSSPCKQ